MGKCSVSKIQRHLSVLFKKAEVKKRADLVSWWRQDLQGIAIEANSVDTPLGSITNSLTLKEMELMEFLELGWSTEEIMSKTRSTKNNISTQLEDLMKKANLNSRTELVRWWRTSREGKGIV